jgi:hypothetical protein
LIGGFGPRITGLSSPDTPQRATTPGPCATSCRGATGEPHESPALTFTEAGRTKTLTLSAGEVDEVAAALARYQTAQAELEARAEAGLARLRGRRAGGTSEGGRR